VTVFEVLMLTTAGLSFLARSMKSGLITFADTTPDGNRVRVTINRNNFRNLRDGYIGNTSDF
jgi:hypothetical protein